MSVTPREKFRLACEEGYPLTKVITPTLRMKPIILLFTVLFFQNVICAQYETLILYYADEPIEIEIPEGKVLGVGTFTDIVGNRAFSLSLLKSGRETTVLASASFQAARENGTLMPFAGPAVLKVSSPLSRPSSTGLSMGSCRALI